MIKETKKIYTINVKASIMDQAKIKAEKEKRSLSAHVELLLERDLQLAAIVEMMKYDDELGLYQAPK